MKLAEIYSNSLSVDLPKSPPDLPIQFFPTPEKYITIQNSSGQPAKDYDLFQNVVDLIFPYLQNQNIEIIQIGAGEVKNLSKVNNLVNKTNFAQSVYLVKNSLLHFGNDSWAAHACAKNTPCVILYGSTSIDAHSPYFFNESSVFLEAHRNGKVPSFQVQENPKTINQICPEIVAAKILDILKITHDLQKIQSIYAGNLYCQGASEIHVIPDQPNIPNLPPEIIPHLRGDLYFDFNFIAIHLSQKKYILHLSRALDLQQLEILGKLKPNIAIALVEIFDDTDPNFIKSLQKLGIPLNLWTQMEMSEHQKIKLDFLDLPLIVRCEDTKKSEVLEKIKNYQNWKTDDEISRISENIFYYSKIHYISVRGLFNSLFAWKNNITVENVEQKSSGKLFDQSFMDEFDRFLIFFENESI